MSSASEGVSPPTRLDMPKAAYGAAITVALLVIGGLTAPNFATVDNALAIVRAASLTGIVAIGMSYMTISGNLFALSASSLAALLAVVFALATSHLGLPAGLALTLALALAVGLLQGASISFTGNPIITTLAFGTAFRGLAAYLSGNSIVRIDNAAALWLGTGRPLGVPTQSWIFVLFAVASWFFIRHVRLGREILLAGANPAAARSSGLRLRLVTEVASTALSLGAAVLAIMTVCQFSQAKADLFTGQDFDYIAAILVGGVALRGGIGSPAQAALGAILIAVLQNYMLLKGFSAGVRMAIVGVLVTASISFFHVLQKRS